MKDKFQIGKTAVRLKGKIEQKMEIKHYVRNINAVKRTMLLTKQINCKCILNLEYVISNCIVNSLKMKTFCWGKKSYWTKNEMIFSQCLLFTKTPSLSAPLVLIV